MRLVILAAFACCCVAATIDDQQFNGRWDIAVNGDSRAWWLEVTGAGTESLKGKFVGTSSGDLDEIPKISIADGELRFAFERHYTRDPKALQKGLYWARLEEGKLKGTFEIEGDPASYLEWTGVRAPALADKDDSAWKKGDPIALFDGHDLSAWITPGSGHTAWSVKEGVLTNAPGSANLISTKKFWNFALHAEYRIGSHGNSGIGLRGRYEVQLLDDIDKPPSVHSNGAIYSRIPPAVNASKPAGEWQTLDVRLVGRQVSVALNGIHVIEKQTIDGITAIALDSNEGDPGPIVLQGDHGPVEFRKIIVYPLVKPR